MLIIFYFNPTYVAHNSWANTGWLRSDCWPAVGNVRFVSRVPDNHLPTMASGWASVNLFFVCQPTTSQQWPTKIIFYWSNSVLKLLGLRLIITGMATNYFPTVSTIYQRWPIYLRYLGWFREISCISFCYIVLYRKGNDKNILFKETEKKPNF